MAVILADLKMTIESNSYIDAMHAVLTRKRWFSFPKPMLAGMTASAFRFTVSRRLTAESPVAYNWIAENFLAADFIGVAAWSGAGFYFDATFPLYKRDAIAQIKGAIDGGIGAILWNNRFVIAAGYDDEREALWISNGEADELVLLPYVDFGRNASPYWYYQVFENRIALDHLEICRESLMQAVHKWETHDPMLPEADYACGRSAYDAILAALHSGDYDRSGISAVIRSYAAAKRDISRYFAALETYWPELRTAVEHYKSLEAAFDEAERLAGSADQQLIPLFAAARQSEEMAIATIKTFMRETIDIRRHDIALR
ncbi:hypothetical protein [Paenibacillus harenae]|uniref:hypothetical protein n=1 Tax=Paenibacillus harenae TaxID=306543 RepID=UPI00040F5CED|nr:hypothetical protein [Paenibacillus harenae]